jgi:2-polyprenyl-3-methyl-5-hydroxy-6-metoxy-1,4-benzoquinol methylase
MHSEWNDVNWFVIFFMKLLAEQELIWSSVVANSSMNRERNASGINSYEQELGFKPEVFLRSCIDQSGQTKWLDLCCGQGKALIQVANYLASMGFEDKVRLKGIDLIDNFLPALPEINCLTFEVGSVIDWQVGDKYDLITCIHGIHYVGDKLQMLTNALTALTPDGLFIANLDLNNIQINNEPAVDYMKNIFRKHNLQYNARKRLLTCKGMRDIDLELTYIGANDQAGPNYTGQAAVCSYYQVTAHK